MNEDRVIALAGRRVDPADADTVRFPESAVPAVTRRVRQAMKRAKATGLVCSAACGADLIALQIAVALGLRCHVILPFGRDRFRATSVTDRPGDWGAIYDRVLAAVPPDAVTVLELQEGADAYHRANERILDRAVEMAGGADRVTALVVWDGRRRGEGDVTAAFAKLAKDRGIDVEEVLTLDATDAAAG